MTEKYFTKAPHFINRIKDIWFYNPRRLRITANSQTVRKAFERL
jgi:hypothetical protein